MLSATTKESIYQFIPCFAPGSNTKKNYTFDTAGTPFTLEMDIGDIWRYIENVNLEMTLNHHKKRSI